MFWVGVGSQKNSSRVASTVLVIEENTLKEILKNSSYSSLLFK